MDKFTTLEGVAAPLKMINVDTDMIIPKQYLKTIKRTGLGTGLFSEKRSRDDGRSCSTTPSVAPMPRYRSTWRSRRSGVPTAVWSSSTSMRIASIACSTVSTISD